MRDHGGNLDAAMAAHGGDPREWIDLSTGINRRPWPLPELPARAWTDLPTRADMARLTEAAHQAYGAPAEAGLVALAGAQAAIQLYPRLASPGLARILAPTYNEHAASLRAEGWRVEEVAGLEALAGADLAVLVNPNNPDGLTYAPEDLLALLPRVGRLIVDESFVDPTPESSLGPRAGAEGLILLRSFGKFYGLAGVRLGFALGAAQETARLASLSGPWPISGAAVEIGARALADSSWRATTAARLSAEALRLDRLAEAAGWSPLGGTTLFRLYETGEAVEAQARLARSRIWSRRFPWSQGWLRLGLPGAEAEWRRLAQALGGPHSRE
ncbi:threonine-phosphate decarboxylase CobD [Neomegalonema sp.]|uniref:threonine-phosphate decarboxylase CobD n=1 Tax=Neomegalonema sp. TaxID=2039713 RepID=UPI0026249553|nr:threonine-phosphate decarboxylase CobD [Neomegalonema sp.]MDD2868378.1 threonine-phosphate decarboxylase CobD [Neomegalonema sp.]